MQNIFLFNCCLQKKLLNIFVNRIQFHLLPSSGNNKITFRTYGMGRGDSMQKWQIFGKNSKFSFGKEDLFLFILALDRVALGLSVTDWRTFLGYDFVEI